MNVYLEEKDIGRRITTYHDGLGTQQGLYVFGKDKIEILSLADYTKQVRLKIGVIRILIGLEMELVMMGKIIAK